MAWRVYRYLRCYPFWGDEAALNLSVLTRDYGRLLEPLAYHQVAPLLFLWLQRTALLLFGAGEYSLRLWSLVAGVASLLLFARLARRELKPIPEAFATGIFAVSFALVRHTCESKPYAGDLFLSTLIIYLVAKLGTRSVLVGTVTVTVISAVSIWLSFSVSFMCAGVSLALAIAALRERSWPRMMAWLGYNLVVGASFVAYWFVFLSSQTSAATTGYLQEFWAGAFPKTESVAGLIGWLVKSHFGLMFAYPFGAKAPGSILTTICFIVGLVAFARKGRWTIIVIFAGAAIANLAAALLHRYPYGGSIRISIHFAPLICLAAGAGLSSAIERTVSVSRRDFARGCVGTSLAALAVLGFARVTLLPFKAFENIQIRAIVRDFAARVAPSERIAVFNTDDPMVRTPQGPPFHTVLRFYLETLAPSEPMFRAGTTLPTDTVWLIRYTYDEETEKDVRRVMRESGLSVMKYRVHPLYDRWNSNLIIYRCESKRKLP